MFSGCLVRNSLVLIRNRNNASRWTICSKNWFRLDSCWISFVLGDSFFLRFFLWGFLVMRKDVEKW